MSSLFKLKYDLYLVEERKLFCEISKSNGCIKCPKVDFTGHFFLSMNNKIKGICSKLIEYCLSSDKNKSTEKIIHMDIQGNIEQIYAIGWCLATITDFYYSNKKTSKYSEEINLRLILTHNTKIFKSLQHPNTKLL